MILAQYGQEDGSGDGYKVWSYYSAVTDSYTFGIKNEIENSIEATLDISGSENLISSSKGTIVKKMIKGGELQFMMHA